MINLLYLFGAIVPNTERFVKFRFSWHLVAVVVNFHLLPADHPGPFEAEFKAADARE